MKIIVIKLEELEEMYQAIKSLQALIGSDDTGNFDKEVKCQIEAWNRIVKRNLIDPKYLIKQF